MKIYFSCLFVTSVLIGLVAIPKKWDAWAILCETDFSKFVFEVAILSFAMWCAGVLAVFMPGLFEKTTEKSYQTTVRAGLIHLGLLGVVFVLLFSSAFFA